RRRSGLWAQPRSAFWLSLPLFSSYSSLEKGSLACFNKSTPRIVCYGSQTNTRKGTRHYSIGGRTKRSASMLFWIIGNENPAHKKSTFGIRISPCSPCPPWFDDLLGALTQPPRLGLTCSSLTTRHSPLFCEVARGQRAP